MKIAMAVRGYLPVPRPVDMVYAPIDLSIALAEGLAQRGHQVDFYAPLGSTLKNANVVSLNLRPLATDSKSFVDLMHDMAKLNHYLPALWDQYFVNEMFARAAKGDYDLLHFNHAEMALPTAKLHSDIPVTYTQHDPLFSWYKEIYELYQSPNQHVISISDNQRRDAPDLQYAATVYNGINLDDFPFCAEAEDYLLFAGRIVPEKGVKEAIQVAQETNKRLLIIGPTYPDHEWYFDQYIKPHLSDKILYLGYIEHLQMAKYFQKAKAFLMPVQWEEPFGLTMIESMACGTPVIATRRGAISEVVKNGVTGYIVDSISDMVAAVKKIDKIDRAKCHEHAKKHFSIELMVDRYEEVFKKIVKASAKKPAK